MNPEILNERNCDHERNFKHSLENQLTVEEYLRATENPLYIGETEVQALLDIFSSEEDIEEEK